MPPSQDDRLNDLRHALLEIDGFLQNADFDHFAANRGLQLNILQHHLPALKAFVESRISA